jgi:hypothetical protein
MDTVIKHFHVFKGNKKKKKIKDLINFLTSLLLESAGHAHHTNFFFSFHMLSAIEFLEDVFVLLHGCVKGLSRVDILRG